jgi:hypothetical protein
VGEVAGRAPEYLGASERRLRDDRLQFRQGHTSVRAHPGHHAPKRSGFVRTGLAGRRNAAGDVLRFRFIFMPPQACHFE